MALVFAPHLHEESLKIIWKPMRTLGVDSPFFSTFVLSKNWPLSLGFRGFTSLPEFMNFKLFGKTILVVNLKFRLFLGHPLRQ